MILEAKHFMLTNGNQLIAEVLQWAEDPDPEIIVRNAIQIVTVERSLDMGGRYYAFRPWMTYQDGNDSIIVLNSDSIIAIADLDADMYNQYMASIFEMHALHELRMNIMQERFNLENQLMMEAIQERLEEALGVKKKKKKKVRSEGNVISFPIPDSDQTVH